MISNLKTVDFRIFLVAVVGLPMVACLVTASNLSVASSIVAVAASVPATWRAVFDSFSGNYVVEIKNLLVWLMAGLAARCILGRRRSLPTVDAPVLDGNLERNAAFYEAAQAPGIPRSLLKNPYGPETSGMCLDERVGIAIRASLEHSRIVGVICMSMRFSPHSYSDTKRASDRMLTNILAKELRDLVRQTEFVHVSRANEIVIFISLLSSRSDLRKICARLSVAAGANLLALGMPADLQAGMSIYPMDGYSATDLVSSAYARTHRTVPAAG